MVSDRKRKETLASVKSVLPATPLTHNKFFSLVPIFFFLLSPFPFYLRLTQQLGEIKEERKGGSRKSENDKRRIW